MSFFVFLALLSILSLPSSSPSVGGTRPCPHDCLCYEQADVVDCGSRGLVRVPRGLPHGTWLLELGGNNFTVVRSRAFTGLWSLRVLVLTQSGIQLLQPQAFFSLSFLEKLDLSFNQLRFLPNDFSHSLVALGELRLQHNSLAHISEYSLGNLDSLEKLDLSHNQLCSLGPRALRGLSKLRHLYLQNNRLVSIRQGTLAMLPGLEVLDLGGNNISYMDQDALASLYSLAVLALENNALENLKFKTFLSLHTTSTHIQLSGNPWSCDCELHRVFSKIQRVSHLHVDDYRNITCHNPPQLAGASLAWVDSRLCVAETATVLVITITVIVTVVAAVVMAERNRRNNGRNWGTELRPSRTPS